MKFDFSKSNDSDFRNKLQLNKLDLMQKNILYLTYQVDWIRKYLTEEQTNKGLQKQVDDYFEDEPEKPPEDTDHL